MAHRHRNHSKPTPSATELAEQASDREESTAAPEHADAAGVNVLSASLVRESAPVARDQRIERAAYRLAEERGFEPGHELEDWLEAEKEIDAELGNNSASHRNSSRL
jgi:hypothetical protein